MFLLGNLPFPHCEGIFCLVLGEVHGLNLFLNFISALSIISLNKYCPADESLKLVSGFVEGNLLGMQRLET